MNGVPKYKVIETTAMGETWYNVALYDIPDDKIDERHIFGSFSKSRKHAEVFCALMNLSYVECRNMDHI